jgi:hypothetical protein
LNADLRDGRKHCDRKKSVETQIERKSDELRLHRDAMQVEVMNPFELLTKEKGLITKAGLREK